MALLYNDRNILKFSDNNIANLFQINLFAFQTTDMASAAVQLPGSHGVSLDEKPQIPVAEKPHHVQTTLNFLKENEDGSPPKPTYADRPETYDRPVTTLPATIHDISGHELDYTLDGHGFQLYYHESQEKDFQDDEKIKREYYPETEQLLKDACATYSSPILN
jgi:hypothetical protein